jgi:signal-transduction protein with cAMP-binding, CBS, and nucleotidyltransferase domain
MDKNFLKKIPLFAELTDDDLDVLAIKLNRITIAEYKHIFWMDELRDRLYIIESGLVHVKVSPSNGSYT